MKINQYTISTIILLSLPFQFNLNIDSLNMFLTKIDNEWVNPLELSYFEDYFLRKIANFSTFISAISFVFIYYQWYHLDFIYMLLRGFFILQLMETKYMFYLLLEVYKEFFMHYFKFHWLYSYIILFNLIINVFMDVFFNL